MISKNKVKYIQSLSLKKFRQKYKKFVIEGDKIARELLKTQLNQIDTICATEDWINANQSNLKSGINKTITVTPSELKRISNLKTPNQVLMVVSMPETAVINTKDLNGIVLYLDGIQDPGNLGTILRTASWFGVEMIALSEDCVDIYNPKVIQGSMGAFSHIPYLISDLKELRSKFPEIPFYGTVLGGKNLYVSDISTPCLVAIGNEGSGLNPANIPLFDELISIPKAVSSQAESLNAGIAAGIICAYLTQSQ